MVCPANRAFGKRDSPKRVGVNKTDIADHVASRTGVGRSAAGNAVGSVFEAIAMALARDEDVRIAGFGTFGTRSRPARTGRNPRTAESLIIAASIVPAFKPGKPLRDAVNAAKS